MKLSISNLYIPIDVMVSNDVASMKSQISKQIGLDSTDIEGYEITRRSIDARKKSNVHYVIAAVVDLRSDIALDHLKLAKGVRAKEYIALQRLEIPDISNLVKKDSRRIVVVGSGPAGLFAALYLAKSGLKPLIIERGKKVEERERDIDDFIKNRVLNPDSNIQFGEGGAGTFSDGKLNTGTKSPFARFVLESFVEAGAPKDILIDAKPHVGTDYLKTVVVNLRKTIESYGGEFRFEQRLLDIVENVDQTLNLTIMRECDQSTYQLVANALVLAIGHSARDTFEMLNNRGFALERKPFAVGVRIEHSQSKINRSQYGKYASELPAADYKLSHHNQDGRGVYTFCNCPGGFVVAASSEENGVCVNGMSDHARGGCNANSALLVEVKPSDLPDEDGVLAGMYFQRELEQRAFNAAGGDYCAPAQTIGEFLDGNNLGNSEDACMKSSPSEHIEPTYPLGIRNEDLRNVLPPFITDAIAEALPQLGRKLDGFDDAGAIMTAVEARSSSPIRICRDIKTLRSPTMAAVFPTGEGAGYAGGIMSAACDGLRIAQQIVNNLLFEARLEECAHSLVSGSPVIFPTDTVVGIGVSVEHAQDASEIYKAKGRDSGKPIAWLVGSIDDLHEYGCDVPEYAWRLAEKYWPGALTLVVHASNRVNPAFVSKSNTIGLRMPDNENAIALMDSISSPLATSSANRSGCESVREIENLDEGWLSDIEVEVLDVPATQTDSRKNDAPLPSTVVDCTGSSPRILREGAISALDILDI